MIELAASTTLRERSLLVALNHGGIAVESAIGWEVTPSQRFPY